MNYCEFINSQLAKSISASTNVISFGQNISLGSCLSGLTKGIDLWGKDNVVINTTNSEYTLSGAGFGAMVHGSNAIFFLKQLDFLFLGTDHLVNTWNALRDQQFKGSFTLFTIVVDSGFEGPQSCANVLPDFCSISRIPGFTIATRLDAEEVLSKNLISSGVRIIAVSQGMWKTKVSTDLDGSIVSVIDTKNRAVLYRYGKDLTVISVNFAFSEAAKVSDKLIANGVGVSLINIGAVVPTTWEYLLSYARSSTRVLICDDSSSQNKSTIALEVFLRTEIPGCRVKRVDRKYTACLSNRPNPDLYQIDLNEIIAWLQRESD